MTEKLLKYDRDTNLMVLEHLIKHSISDLANCYRHFSHIIWAHEIWLGRIHGTAIPEDQWAIIPRHMLEVRVGKNFNDFREICKPENFHRIIYYTDSEGTSFRNSVGDILDHIIIHGQHHRAQISLLLRLKGIEPPATDLIYYLRES